MQSIILTMSLHNSQKEPAYLKEGIQEQMNFTVGLSTTGGLSVHKNIFFRLSPLGAITRKKLLLSWMDFHPSNMSLRTKNGTFHTLLSPPPSSKALYLGGRGSLSFIQSLSAFFSTREDIFKMSNIVSSQPPDHPSQTTFSTRHAQADIPKDRKSHLLFCIVDC